MSIVCKKVVSDEEGEALQCLAVGHHSAVLGSSYYESSKIRIFLPILTILLQ